MAVVVAVLFCVYGVGSGFVYRSGLLTLVGLDAGVLAGAIWFAIEVLFEGQRGPPHSLELRWTAAGIPAMAAFGVLVGRATRGVGSFRAGLFAGLFTAVLSVVALVPVGLVAVVVGYISWEVVWRNDAMATLTGVVFAGLVISPLTVLAFHVMLRQLAKTIRHAGPRSETGEAP